MKIRENELFIIADLTLRGASYNRISQTLGVNVSTVKYHVDKHWLPSMMITSMVQTPEGMTVIDMQKINAKTHLKQMEDMWTAVQNVTGIAYSRYFGSRVKDIRESSNLSLVHLPVMMYKDISKKYEKVRKSTETKICIDCKQAKEISSYERDPAHVKCETCFYQRIEKMFGPDVRTLTADQIRQIAGQKGYRSNVFRLFALPEGSKHFSTKRDRRKNG